MQSKKPCSNMALNLTRYRLRFAPRSSQVSFALERKRYASMAGRLPKYQEFLHTLSEILELKGAAFAKAIGKKYTNVSQYLSGSKKVGPRTLRTALYHLGEWEVKALLEVQPQPANLTKIQQTPSIYALYDSSASILYVGQAKRLRAKITQTLNRKTNFPIRSGPKLTKKHHPKFKDITTRISVYEVPSARLRHNIEALLLRVFPNQSHNNKLGKLK